jgi:hypothetical protein
MAHPWPTRKRPSRWQDAQLHPCPVGRARLLYNKVPGTSAWAFVDDGTPSKANQADNNRAVNNTLLATSEFGRALHIKEHTGKRQLWATVDDVVEHLGLLSKPLCPTTPIQPQDGWAKLTTLVSNLAAVPGAAAMRKRLAMCSVVPEYQWATPLLSLPPPAFTRTARQAIMRTSCKWWCEFRWYADRIALHRRLGTAAVCRHRAYSIHMYPSLHFERSVSTLACELGLRSVAFSTEHGSMLSAARRLTLTFVVPSRKSRANDETREFSVRHLAASTQAAEHTCRVAARVQPRRRIRQSRLDSEGSVAIDIAVRSHPIWTKWRKQLNLNDSSLLSIYRGCAIGIATHRHNYTSDSNGHLCGQAWGSARLLRAKCFQLAQDHAAIGTEHKLPRSLWTTEPRVTSKSGWITRTAGSPVARQATVQAAACEPGIECIRKTQVRLKSRATVTTLTVVTPTVPSQVPVATEAYPGPGCTPS